ncbi:Histone methylation protein DOT1 [Seminavis robusta]|uniref:Histone-lysine N-methyltransferase, H3 lysine-79 specific n=1 Tax=Seminavis robusta TaxID=568900 RepID=A0A9N8H7Z3_9STRA|nr:Histone methylation protein DOT1 [Seminavis robusta]|eukprot:Sro219_g090440.1 Histone methylation protein DOT1 (456) ;mRNA; r:41360-42727
MTSQPMYRYQRQNLPVLLLASFLLLAALPVSSFVYQPGHRNSNPKSIRISAITTSDPLLPEENPDIDENQESLSGVSYRQVLQGLSRLYPPESLEERNAASRTDGYWPFIQKGQDPPKQFTYGEFDLGFFAQLLDRVQQEYDTSNDGDGWKDKVFCDIGSGAGRLVLAAAALHPQWKLCRGIEILQGISDVANAKLQECRDTAVTGSSEEEEEQQQQVDDSKEEDDDDDEEWVENEHGLLIKRETPEGPEEPETSEEIDATATYRLAIDDNQRLPLAPVEFVCGSFEDPYLYFGDVDCVFCFSSCMSESILQSLSQAIGRQCKPGAIVITTDFSLELEGYIGPYPDDDELPYGGYQLELVEHVDGYCWLTGGQSTAYIHRVQKSLWEPGSGPRIKPELPASEKAFRAIQAMEQERDEAAVKFLSGVRNNMVFAGYPEQWMPDPSDYQSRNEPDED